MIRTRNTYELTEVLESAFENGYCQGVERLSLISLAVLTRIRSTLKVVLVPGDEATMNSLLNDLEDAVLNELLSTKA